MRTILPFHSRMFLWTLLVLTITAAPLLQVLSAAEPEGIRKVTAVEGITEYRLDNGLKVLLFPDTSKATVTVNLTVFVGSRHEGYGEAGMAHLLEHMLFKGTPTHEDIPKLLQDRGARFNGTTWLDRTNYFETLPAKNDNLEFALRLEADRFVNSSIKAEDLESEMTVVRNEFERIENSPRYVMDQRMTAAAYEWHNYGKSTIGNRADIERVPIEKLRDFYEKYYQPDNAMLIVAGRFKTDEAIAAINHTFGAIPRPERELDATYTQEPPQDGERLVTLRRVGDVPLVGAVYHIPAGPHPNYPPFDVLESILTAEPTGRLYKALVESKKAASLSGTAYALHDPGVIQFFAEVSQGEEPRSVLSEMLNVIETVAENEISEEEVERARRRLLKQRELAAADTSRLAVELSEWAAQGDWRLYFLYRDRIEGVTVDDVKRVAAKYLRRNNRTAGLFLPTEEPQRVRVPETPNLAEMIGDYEGRETAAAGEAFDVSPQNIEKRTRRLDLPGGIKAAFLEKQTRNEAVHLRLTLRYGNEDNLRGLATAAEFLPSLMIRGTETLTYQQLQDELDKLQTELNASGEAGEATFTIQTRREHLPDVVDLLRQILREPTLPENELDILKREQIAGLQQQLTEPQALATRTVRRKLYPYASTDPRYIPTIQEEIERVKSLTPAAVRKLYADYLGAQAGELSLVGDFETDKILPLLRKMFADWKAPQPYARLKHRVFPSVKGGFQTILTRDKANATYFAATALPMSDAHPDYPAMVIGNFILGGGSLSSRLGNRVRQQEGLSYGVGSGFQARSLDPRSAFYMYAIFNPNNLIKVKTAIHEELTRLLEEGVTGEELAAAKQGYLQRQEVRRTDDSGLTRILQDTLFADRTMQYHAELEETIHELTTKQVHKALRKHLDPKRLVEAAAGDFEKDAKESP